MLLLMPMAYDPNKVKPGWIAFFVVMILLVATFFLWWSMTRQLRKIKVPSQASYIEADRAKRAVDDTEPPPEPDSHPSP